MPNLKCVKCGLEVGAEKIAAGAKRCARCGTAFAELAPPPLPTSKGARGKGDQTRRARVERGDGSSSQNEAALVREALADSRRATRRMTLVVGGAMLAGAAVCAGLFELGRRTTGSAPPEQIGADATAEAARLADDRAAAQAEQATASDGAAQLARSTAAKADEAPAPAVEPPAELKEASPPEPNATLPSAAAAAASKPKLPPQQTSPTLQEILAEVEASVVTLRVRTADGERVGSGFIVDADGTIATNYHVIEGAQEVIVELGSSVEVPAEGYRAIAPRRDLALIAGPASALPERPVALETALPSKTAQVFTVGSPMGEYEGTVTSGIVSGIRQGAAVDPRLDPAVKLIQTTAPVSKGNSGGPLLDSLGRAIGVTTGSATEGQNLNFAIASQHVVELLKAQSRSPLLWAQLPAPRAKPKDFAQAAVVPPQPPTPPAADSSGQSTDGRVAAQIAESEAKAKQGKLERINKRIRDLEARRDNAEDEGRRLADNLNVKQAEAEGVNTEGINVHNEFDRQGVRLLQLEQQRQRDRDNNLPTFFLTQQIYDIGQHRRRLDRQWKQLESRHASLVSEVNSISQRIDAQRGVVEDIDAESEYLNLQGQIVDMGSARFVEKLFRDFDDDKNGVLIAKEVPDQYHPVLHDAAGKNKYGVSKEQLGLFLEGFGDAPK